MNLENIVAEVVAKEMAKERALLFKNIEEYITVLVDKVSNMKAYPLQSFVSEEVASELTGYSMPTLRKWRTYKKGPQYYKTEKSVRYKVQDLIEFMEKDRVLTSGSM